MRRGGEPGGVDFQSKCASGGEPGEVYFQSKCASKGETGQVDFRAERAGGSETGQVDFQSKCEGGAENICMQCQDDISIEILEETRKLCTMPDSARPAETFLLDVLESRSRNYASNDTGISNTSNISGTPGICNTPCGTSLNPEPTMSIRFFLPRDLYGVWNEAVRRYLMLIPPEEGIELLAEGEGTDRFIALLLSDYLSTERAHHKAMHNNKILERDGHQCQAPGCSSRRNLNAHHIEFRSEGGSDKDENQTTLCIAHHLWILHHLHGLKIEGTAPHNLTFTFGANSGADGKPFMTYKNGRKVLAPAPEESESSRNVNEANNSDNTEEIESLHNTDRSESLHNTEVSTRPRNTGEAGLFHNTDDAGFSRNPGDAGLSRNSDETEFSNKAGGPGYSPKPARPESIEEQAEEQDEEQQAA